MEPKSILLPCLKRLSIAGFRKIPGGRHYARIIVPDSVATESFDPSANPGWELEDGVVSRSFGDQWIKDKRSALLRVPSAVTRGPEWNIVINAAHPQFSLITIEPTQPVSWDTRLLR